MTHPVLNWGRIRPFEQKSKTVRSVDETCLVDVGDNTILPHGMGRSYGDSCLSTNGTLLQMTNCDNIISFDKTTGIIKAESGLTIDKLLKATVPAGWIMPVTPGTKFVSIGGAIANDVHGKNHHNAGSLGSFIKSFALQRSGGKTLICSPNKNTKYFKGTIGGLGLTGVILWAEIQLKPIKSSYLDVENTRFSGLDDFFELNQDNVDWPYTVAWVDCFAPKSKLGRGIFTRAKFTDYGALDPHNSDTKLTWLFPTPSFLLNRLSISTFNWLYRWRPGSKYVGRQHYDPFFYPLDKINKWNFLYGKAGFHQHQSLIPMAVAKEGVTELLSIIKASGQGSFLAVMKVHGPETSPGLLSFGSIGEGVSLALDFANKGPKTLDLLSELDECVQKHQGRTYVAKDGRMSADFFQASYPKWENLEALRDPAISSSFWQRVSKTV